MQQWAPLMLSACSYIYLMQDTFERTTAHSLVASSLYYQRLLQVYIVLMLMQCNAAVYRHWNLDNMFKICTTHAST